MKMCQVKLLTSQFGSFPFIMLHCDGFDDAKTKPRTKPAHPRVQTEADRRGKKNAIT